jgi:SCY1-like protein 2
MAANILSAATTTLGYLAGAKSSALSAYVVHSGTSSEEKAEPFRVGLWKVVRGRHRTTGRQVSIWTWDKRPGEAVEAMKREVSPVCGRL